MKKELILIIITSFIFTLSCQQNQTKVPENSTTTTKLDTNTVNSEDNVNQTDTIDESYSNEMAEKSKQKINEINSTASQSNKVEAKILLNEIEDTPVVIWYTNDKLPIKIEYGVTDDAGEFIDKFTLYFTNGKLWCSDWILAKFIFDENGKLKYWLNESWKTSETEETTTYFKQKEEMNFNTLNQILSKVKLN